VAARRRAAAVRDLQGIRGGSEASFA